MTPLSRDAIHRAAYAIVCAIAAYIAYAHTAQVLAALLIIATAYFTVGAAFCLWAARYAMSHPAPKPPADDA